jgi:hypothetical protein
MKYFQYSINGDDWKIGLLSPEEMATEHSDVGDGENGAVTMASQKKMDVCEDSLTDETIMHELVHIHASYMFYEDANPTPAQMEEIFAEFFGQRHKLLVKQKNAIRKKLKELGRDDND